MLMCQKKREKLCKYVHSLSFNIRQGVIVKIGGESRELDICRYVNPCSFLLLKFCSWLVASWNYIASIVWFFS